MTRIVLLCVLAANMLMVGLFANTFFEERNLLEQDYLGYYTAARLPRTEIYDIDRQRAIQVSILGHPYKVPAGVLLFNHPPPLVPAVKALSSDNYVQSYRRWALVLFLVLLLCAGVVYGLLRDAGLLPLASTVSAFTAVLFYPLYRSVEIGTDTPFVVLGGLLWAFLLLRKRERWAGIALSLTLVKPHFAIVLAAATFACNKRAFVWFISSAALLTLASILYVGEKGTVDLIGNIRLSINGEPLGVLLTRQYNFAGLLARAEISNGVVTVIGGIGFVAATIYLALGRKAAIDLRVAYATLAALFFSPNLHFHDVALLLVPMAIIARRVASESAPLIFLPLSAVLILSVGLTVSAYAMQAATMVGLYVVARARPISAPSTVAKNILTLPL